MKESPIEVKAVNHFNLPATIAEDQRPLTVITDPDGNPWWVAHEVCKVLGYAAARNAVNMHCKSPKILKGTDSVRLGFGPRGVLLIKESDLYRLIMRSNVEAAEKFQDWVTEEVLPQIRKTGSYNAKPAEVPLVSLENIQKLHGALGFTLKELERKEEVITQLETQTKQMAPKAKFFDAVSNARGNVNLTVAAKILGRGPNKMMALLRTLGILYYTRNGINVPAQR